MVQSKDHTDTGEGPISGGRAGERPGESVRPDDAHNRELATWRRLAHDLAGELHQVLTSRRWRSVMAVVRLRNLLLRLPEGDPVDAHLNRHLRAAGLEPESLGLPAAGARRTRRRFRLRLPSGGRTQMRLLSEKRKRAAVDRLLCRDQEILVSVVLPTWNRGDQVATAVRSVRAQSYETWELLVVDDGSTDATAEVVGRLCADDGRIRYLAVPHGGASAARNAGVRAARGELVAYLDSDNAWDPDHLLFLVHAVRDSGRRCAYAALRVTDHDQQGAVTLRRRRFDLGALLKNNFIDLNVFVHRAELFHELGGFDPELERWEDWDLILRYVRKSPPVEVPVVLCDYKREKRSHQLTLEEPGSYKHKVLNRHLIDWAAHRWELRNRERGLVSVIVPNHDLPEMTATCVETILAAGGPVFEIVVVDNGSTPRNRRGLRTRLGRYGSVRLLETYENYGFALGCNLGAAAARGEYLIWLNNDTEVTRGWAEALIRPLRDDPEVGIVGPKLLFPDGTVQHAGLVFGPRSKIPYHVYKGFPGDHPAVNRRRRFRSLTGACLAVRASDVVELQGFDPIYLNDCEDVDYCLRMEAVLGRKVVYEPAAVVIHHEGSTPERTLHIRRNRETFVGRWRDGIEADDQHYYRDDGFVVTGYLKTGPEPDGETALYHAELAPGPDAVAPPNRSGARGE